MGSDGSGVNDIDTLAILAEEDPEAVVPHLDKLVDTLDDGPTNRQKIAAETIALVAVSNPAAVAHHVDRIVDVLRGNERGLVHSAVELTADAYLPPEASPLLDEIGESLPPGWEALVSTLAHIASGTPTALTDAVPLLAAVTAVQHEPVREEGVRALAAVLLEAPERLAELEPLIRDGSPPLCTGIARTLALVAESDPTIVRGMIPVLFEPLDVPPGLRKRLGYELRTLSQTREADRVANLLASTFPFVQVLAGKVMASAVGRYLNDPLREYREYTTLTTYRVVKEYPSVLDPAVDDIVDMLDDVNDSIQGNAAHILSRYVAHDPKKVAEVFPHAISTLEHPNPTVRQKVLKLTVELAQERPDTVVNHIGAPFAAVRHEPDDNAREHALYTLVILSDYCPEQVIEFISADTEKLECLVDTACSGETDKWRTHATTILAKLTQSDVEFRSDVRAALGAVGFKSILTDDAEGVVFAALELTASVATTLGEQETDDETAELIPLLLQHLDRKPKARNRALTALAIILGLFGPMGVLTKKLRGDIKFLPLPIENVLSKEAINQHLSRAVIEQNLPAAVTALESAEETFREIAAGILARLAEVHPAATSPATDALCAYAEDNSMTMTGFLALRHLAPKHLNPRAVHTLATGIESAAEHDAFDGSLRSVDPERRNVDRAPVREAGRALRILGEQFPDKVGKQFVQLCNHDDPAVRKQAFLAYSERDKHLPEMGVVTVNALSDPSLGTRVYAARVAANVGVPSDCRDEAVKHLRECRKSDHKKMSEYATVALQAISEVEID